MSGFAQCKQCGATNSHGETECRTCGAKIARSGYIPKEADTNEDGRRMLDVAGSKVDTQCAWNDHGVRCQRGGSQSDATNGFGPLYCRVHYRKLNGWPEREEPETAEERYARRMARYVV